MDLMEVQKTEQVSVKEPVSTGGETTQKTEAGAQKVEPTQPTPDELLQTKIAEAVSKAVALETEKARRELQSTKDRAMAEVNTAQRRARVAETVLGSTRTSLQTEDPDLAKTMRLAELEAEKRSRAEVEQEEVLIHQQQEFHNTFISGLSQFITSLGVDPTDKRIDWAADSPNYLEAQRRVLDSVSRIQKEQVQTMKTGLEKRLSDLEKKVGKVNVEVNSVDTTTSGGVVNQDDKAFIKAWNDGSLPSTKENLARAQKLLD